jgi:hypothetical protein
MAYHFFWHLVLSILKVDKKPVLNAFQLDASVRWHDKLFLIVVSYSVWPGLGKFKEGGTE